MSAYITRDEFRLLAIPSGSYGPPGTTISGATKPGIPDFVVDIHISGSSGQLDAALQHKHTVPPGGLNPSDVPWTLKYAVVVLTSYRLMTYTGIPGDKAQIVKDLYQEIVGKGGYLDRLRDGSELIDNAVSPSGTAENVPLVGTIPSVYSNYIIDSDGKKIEFI